VRISHLVAVEVFHAALEAFMSEIDVPSARGGSCFVALATHG
jgi:hypothetical protein